MPVSFLKDLSFEVKTLKIAIASDHAGVDIKEEIKGLLEEMGYSFIDFGTYNRENVDYPDMAELVAERVSKGELEKGILICGTGIGMCIVANKFPGVRAALVYDLYSARYAKEHNDANILIMGGRTTDKESARKMVEIWLKSQFQGERHQRRLDKIKKIEERLYRIMKE